MIAHEQEKGLAAREFPRPPDGMGVAERLGLFNEDEPLGVRAGGGRRRREFVAR